MPALHHVLIQPRRFDQFRQHIPFAGFVVLVRVTISILEPDFRPFPAAANPEDPPFFVSFVFHDFGDFKEHNRAWDLTAGNVARGIPALFRR